MWKILHHYNNGRNAKTIEDMKKIMGSGLQIQLNSNGQAVLGMYLDKILWYSVYHKIR